jgi:hypothetical protein
MAHPVPRIWLYTIRFGVYLAFAWGVVAWRDWLKRRRETAARTWPTVEAVILTGSVAPIPKTSCFLATLQYTYFAGEYHTGTYLHHFPREIDADDFVRRIQNQRIPVRYNPAHPEKSVLEQSVVEQHTRALAPSF